MVAGQPDVSLMYLNNFTINKWEDLLLGSLYNAVIAKKIKSVLMNALTVFGEERCRQSKRKLHVLVRCMKLASFLDFFVMYVLDTGIISSKCYSY